MVPLSWWSQWVRWSWRPGIAYLDWRPQATLSSLRADPQSMDHIVTETARVPANIKERIRGPRNISFCFVMARSHAIGTMPIQCSSVRMTPVNPSTRRRSITSSGWRRSFPFTPE